MMTRVSAVLALQGYQAISDLRTGTIARVEVGTGIKHAHADYHEQDIRGQGNIINGAKGIEITAREGYIDLSQWVVCRFYWEETPQRHLKIISIKVGLLVLAIYLVTIHQYIIAMD